MGGEYVYLDRRQASSYGQVCCSWCMLAWKLRVLDKQLPTHLLRLLPCLVREMMAPAPPIAPRETARCLPISCL